MSYQVFIDGKSYDFEDPVPTGRQLLDHAGKYPAAEYRVIVMGPRRQLEDIDLEETADLREPGREVFFTFKSDRSFNFMLDGRRQPWGSEKITEKTLLEIAGLGGAHRVWQELKNEPDRLLARGEEVTLGGAGVERFFTGEPESTAGSSLVPRPDRRYLEDHGLHPEAVIENNQKGLVFPSYPLPDGKFNLPATDVLILLPAGYPDAPPDMFFCNPPILLADGCPAASTDATFPFHGRMWQRWSRHNSSWRPGIDGIHTMLQRVNSALENATR